VLAGALYYLVSATLAAGALFLLRELVERSRGFGSSVLAVTLEAFEAQGWLHADPDPGSEEPDDAGVAIPAAMAFLGLSFVCCALLISGLPPLSGFIAKFALLDALLDYDGLGSSPAASVAPSAWAMLALLVVSGMAAVIALGRIGIRAFWVPVDRSPPRLRVIEATPVVVIVLLCVALTVQAGSVMRYLDATVATLRGGGDYSRAVLSAPPVPAPGSSR
jgi:multicomponent K+:H+ antiporter subunit D